MEDWTELPVDSVPCFLRGLEILLVDYDTVSQNYFSSLLEEYSFTVTATDLASVAVSMICNQKRRFKLVIAKVGMPDMDTLSFQRFLLEKDIPVIFITSGGYDDLMQKALAQGSCYFLQEPIRSQDLKYVWQHAYFTKNHLTPNSSCGDKVHGAKKTKRTSDEKSTQNEKRAKVSSEQISIHSNYHTANQDEANIIREYNYNLFAARRSTLWTPRLQTKFTEALTALGPENVRPKRVLEMMNEHELTRRQVSSHLQKFQSQMQRVQTVCNNQLPQGTQQSNFSTKFPSPFQSQSYLGKLPFAGSSTLIIGSPASTASVNDSQNQYQLPMNFTETQGQEFFQLQETLGHATFQNELTTGLTNYGSQDLTAVVGLPATAASVDPYQSLTVFDGNLNPDAAVGNPVPASTMDQNQSQMVYDDISTLDAISGNHVPAAAIDQNQSQMVYDDISTLDASVDPYQSLTVFDGNLNPDAAVGNPVPASTMDQNQSQMVYDDISTLDSISGNHVPAAAIDQNQSQMVYDDISTLDAISGNHVPAAAIDQNQSQSVYDDLAILDTVIEGPMQPIQSPTVYDDILSLDTVVGNHVPAATKDQNQSQTVYDDLAILDTVVEGPMQPIQSPAVYDDILSLDTVVGNHAQAATKDQNQSQTVYDNLAILDTEVEGPMQPIQSPTVYDDILSLDTVVGNHVPGATKDQNQPQTVYDDLAILDTVIGSPMQPIQSPTLYDILSLDTIVGNHVPAAATDQNQSQSRYSLYIARDGDSDNGPIPAATRHQKQSLNACDNFSLKVPEEDFDRYYCFGNEASQLDIDEYGKWMENNLFKTSPNQQQPQLQL